MADCGLNLSFTVENKLSREGEIQVDIPVTGMASFKPEVVASAVPALSRLPAAQKLRTELQKIVPELEEKSGLKPI